MFFLGNDVETITYFSMKILLSITPLEKMNFPTSNLALVAPFSFRLNRNGVRIDGR